MYLISGEKTKSNQNVFIPFFETSYFPKNGTWMSLLVIFILVNSYICPALSDIYAGDRVDPYFTARPNSVSNYGQWGHYPIMYQDPNRPLETINKYDPRYSAVTPNTYNRYRIEDPGDLRCREAVKEGLLEFVTVTTPYGTVEGRVVYLCDEPGVPLHEQPRPAQYIPVGAPHKYRPITQFRRNVTAFLGIPYARPPTKKNNLRFKRTLVPDQWGSIRADRYRAACPQYKRFIHADLGIPFTDEDCLYMNIFTPWAATQTRSLYPVMIYIHGGHFDHGSGNIFPGHMLAATQEVVVVTFNYRLGLLGFLATSDNSSAGNYGLFDQMQAINFVREVIVNFNGDPNRITLFGPDAGAVSAGLLAMSPLTRRYIKRVIAQSGAAVADWAIIKDPLFMRNNTVIAGRAFGCSTRTSYILVECLKSRSATDFTTTEIKPDVGWLAWAPVVDKYTRTHDSQLLPELPEVILNKRLQLFDPDFAYMSGVTRDEGSQSLFSDEELQKQNYEINQEQFAKRVREYVKVYNYTLDQERLVSAITFMYSPWNDPENKTLIRQGVIDMITDSWYTGPNDKMVKLMLKNNVVTYMYMLNYTIQGLNLPSWIGVPHDTEYLLASGAPFMDPRFYPKALKLDLAQWTEQDRNISQLLMETWANFAKKPVCTPNTWNCGPTPYALFNTIIWKPMSLENLQYLAINSTNYTTNIPFTSDWENSDWTLITFPYSTSTMWRNYKQKSAQFWNSYVPLLVGTAPITWMPTVEPYFDELRIYRAATWSILATLIVLLFFTLMCSCLYCRAKSYRYTEEYVPVPVLDQPYAPASARANSENNLNYIQTMRFRNNNEYMPQSPSVMMNNSNHKTRSMEKLYSPRYDRHTEV
ncbi:neuroligin-4, Y-linked-like protein [Euroglyphus maynei]|uniref:Neuroligin-4, Y-linked-like protein n=1 Tax=Euroglyphus maynei TaxID=6958 RepID=A0A1Y3AU77_EURMA|nr:neuroligin-4, Y-linked-like protein [Euroglyphus maynei]